MVLRRCFDALSSLAVSALAPARCEVCGRLLVSGEQALCLHCLAQVPRTMTHLDPDNELFARVAARIPLERAAAWMYYFRQSSFSQLVRTAKYNDRPLLARLLGRLMAGEMAASGFFDGVDVLLPVPMWWGKQWLRGYNQSRLVALGIADVTGIPVGDNLVARRFHSSQTRLGAFDRYLNVRGSVAVAHPGELAGLHVMVVDDVITTGSTMSACVEALAALPLPPAVSIAAVAMARR